MQEAGCRVQGLEVGAETGLGCQDIPLLTQNAGAGIGGGGRDPTQYEDRRTSGFRVQGSGFRVQGSGVRVQGSGCAIAAKGTTDSRIADDRSNKRTSCAS